MYKIPRQAIPALLSKSSTAIANDPRFIEALNIISKGGYTPTKEEILMIEVIKKRVRISK